MSPDMGRRGAGFGIGDLMKAAGDAFSVTPLGGLTQLPNLLTGDGGWGQKLLYGGLLAGGAALGAHEWHAARKLERMAAVAPMEAGLLPAPRAMRSEIGRAIGLPERYSPGTLEGSLVLKEHPGIKARTADILGAKDFGATVRHLTDLEDVGKVAAATQVLDDYSRRLVDVDPAGRLGAVQADWAKLQTAVDHGVLTAGDNPVFTDLWKKFKKDPDLMSLEERTQLVDLAYQISTATRGIVQPDLSFDLVANVSKITATEDGKVFVHLSGNRLGWDEESLADQAVRSARIKTLNARQLTGRAGDLLKHLYRKGTETPEAEARFLARGKDWYRFVHNEIATKLDEVTARMPWLDMDRLVAAVSLTSEATDWEQNIALAVRALDTISSKPEFSSEGFQAWLRATAGAKTGDGSTYQHLFDAAHDELTNSIASADFRLFKQAKNAEWKALPKKGRPAFNDWFEQQLEDAGESVPEGNFLSAKDLKKVLRLYSESGPELFATTSGQKQKNFYLNMMDPDAPDPVTIDRHAYDIFYGLATHSDFKGLEKKSLSDDMYELMADVYRHTAEELGVTPNQLQGVTWQTWRVLKDEWNAKSHNYRQGRGPFRLNEVDGSPNIVWDTIAGRPTPAVKDMFQHVPDKVAFVTGGKGTGVVILPDGSGSVATHFTKEWSNTLRHLYPSVQDEHGVVMWAQGKPLAVHDVAEVQHHLDETLVGHHVESMSVDAWEGMHPAERPGSHVLLELPEGAQVPAKFKRLIEPGGNGQVAVHRPDPSTSLSTVRLRPAQLAPDTFVDPASSPLVTHRWAAISAAIDDDQAGRFGLGQYDNATRHAELGARLRELGYEPIEQSGVYGGAPEPSWLVFGITPEEAIKIGGDFHQDAVITNDHMWYTKAAKDPSDVGKAQAFDPKQIRLGVEDDDYVSITPVAGQEIRWTTAYDWESPHEEIDPRSVMSGDVPTRTPSKVRQLAVQLTPAQVAELERTVADLERNGAKVHTVYSPGDAPEGWVPVRDHIYQDGIAKMVVRTADKETVSPHGFTGWVREADAVGLPRSNPMNGRPKARVAPTQAGGMLRYGQVAFADQDIFSPKVRQFTVDLSGQVPVFKAKDGPVFDHFYDPDKAPAPEPTLVRKIDDRFIITAEDPLDITDQVAIQNTLHQLGVPPSKIRMNIGKEAASMDYPEPKAPRKKLVTSFGLRARDLIRTGRPLPEILDSTGVKVDPYVRDHAGKLVKLADDLVDPIHTTIKRFQDEAGELLQVAGFENVGMSLHPTDWFDELAGESPAWYQSQFRGKIALNKNFWTNSAEITKYLDEHQASGYMNPHLPNDPSTLFAHEMGHAVHQGLIMAFRVKGNSGYGVFEDEIKALIKRIGGWDAVETQVSGYGAKNIDEFMAETLAEAIMSPNPRPVAAEVYSLVRKHFEAQRAPLKEGMGWAR